MILGQRKEERIMRTENIKSSVVPRLEAEDIFLRKAVFEDWEAMYRNVWSRPETARFMVWRLTTSEEDAKARIQRAIEYQKSHDSWLVCERKSGQVIGFAGVEERKPHSFEETGIALGPEYVGRGYGKQILGLLLRYCAALGGKEFYYSTRAKNEASRALARSCGFIYQYSEEKTDPRNGRTYEVKVYRKMLESQHLLAQKL